MKTLLEQFNEMNKMSIFEINLQDYGLSDNEDYTYTHIMANECGLRCEGVPLFLRVYKEGCNDKHIDRLLNDILKEYGKHWENGFDKELWIAKQAALDNHKRGIKWQLMEEEDEWQICVSLWDIRRV